MRGCQVGWAGIGAWKWPRDDAQKRCSGCSYQEVLRNSSSNNTMACCLHGPTKKVGCEYQSRDVAIPLTKYASHGKHFCYMCRNRFLWTKSVHIVLTELHHHTVPRGLYMPCCNNCAWGEVWAGFWRHTFFWYCTSRASTGLSKHRSPPDRRFPDFQHASARGGGTLFFNSWRLPQPQVAHSTVFCVSSGSPFTLLF